jgi:hypothetical protein
MLCPRPHQAWSLRGPDRTRGRNLGGQTEHGGNLDAVGRQRQSRTDRCQRRRALEHGHADTAPLQRYGEGQTADPRTGNDVSEIIVKTCYCMTALL